MDACKRLLGESKFAETWDVDVPGYYRVEDTTWEDGDYLLYYEADNRAHIADLLHDTDPWDLIISYDGTNNASDFIRDYNVAPYTYTLCLIKPITDDSEFKPFTYYTPHAIFNGEEPEQLPLCVVYNCQHNIPSVLKVRDNKMEYTVAKKLQNGEPITTLKSARH